jgi:glycosyltransferase involved in cell wall biosynthesis
VRLAIVHDWLTGLRGGEKVLAELLRIFPDADLLTLFVDANTVPPQIASRVRQTSFLQRLPAKPYRYYLPLFPLAARTLNLNGYDAILSSSHAVAKGVCVPHGTLHVSYVHTPMRYIWDQQSDYFCFGPGRLRKRFALAAVRPWLRRFDLRTAGTVDHFIANSETVRGRIAKLYCAHAAVVYPPVDTDFYTPAQCNGDYYLMVSPLEPYKRVDLAVSAFSGGTRRLLIAGTGSLADPLRRIARPPVEFLGWVSDSRLRELYQSCRALIFPGTEDFGMVPVEAQACGRPVICFAKGGATETVVDGITGVHFHEQSARAISAAVRRSESTSWDTAVIRRNSLRFSRQLFEERFLEFWSAHVTLKSQGYAASTTA